MTKFPINLLLYVVIIALLGGIGWQFYLEVSRQAPQHDQARVDAAYDKVVSNAQFSVQQGTRYDGELWREFRVANLIGKEPPKPEVIDPLITEPKEVVKVQTPLEDILSIACILHDAEGSWVVAEYQESAGVQPPPEVLEAMQGATNTGRDTTPRNVDRRRRRPTGGGPDAAMNSSRSPSVPMAGGGRYRHLLKIEDRLWVPFEHIRLVRVADDATHALFVREDIPEAERSEEKLYPSVLDLPQDILEKLQKGIGLKPRPTSAGNSATAKVETNDWVDIPETKEIARNRFNIGTKDREQFRTNANRIFNEDVGTASYSSPGGNIKGVKITRLAPGYDRYGIEEGEVLVSLNGEKVSSKAEALRVGKRLYKQGVRTFEAEFLQRGKFTTRTYVAPDK